MEPLRSQKMCSSTAWGVKATAGVTRLSGEDFDNRIVDFCMQDFKHKDRGNALGGAHRVGIGNTKSI